MLEWLVGFVVLLLSVIYYYILVVNPRNQVRICEQLGCKKIPTSNPTGLCDYENCIRCNRNEEVQRNAINKYRKYFKGQSDLERLDYSFNNCLKSKHLLFCDFLTTKAIWQSSDLPETYRNDLKLLKDNIQVFQKDFKSLVSYYKRQSSGISSSESWSKLCIMNQGVFDDENISTCMNTNIVLKNCSNLMVDCLFGYQFFSVLQPGSTIAKHTGPTNIRLRCHVSVQIPKSKDNKTVCEMEVLDDETVSWREDGVLLFDDSLPHSVKYAKTADVCEENDRVVLLLDFWHPDLKLEERSCLQNCFSPQSF